MQAFMIALLETSLTMSIIILIYTAITPFLSKKVTAKGRYYGWLVIVIGMIIPFRFYTKESAIYLEQFLPSLKNMNLQSTYQVISNGSIVPSDIPWSLIVGGLWFTGAVLFIVYQVTQHRRFLRMVRRWSTDVVDQVTLDLLENVKVSLGVKEQINLRVCPSIKSPMLLGFIRPTLLIPFETIPSDELPLIFKHELVHFKRKDVWYKTLVVLATALHWFNPFVYLMAREISIQCEISCDEEVIKNTNLACRKKYVEAIIGVIRKQSKLQSKFLTNFYAGKQGVKNRVFSIMDMKHKKSGLTILAMIVIATLSTGMILKVNAPVSAEPVIKNIESIQPPQASKPIITDDGDKTITKTQQAEKSSQPKLMAVESETSVLIELETKNASEPDAFKVTVNNSLNIVE